MSILSEESRDARRTLEAVGRLMGERIGLVRSFRQRRAAPDGVGSFDYVSRMGRLGRSGDAVPTTGGGAQERWRSMAAAIGEAAERYCLGIYAPEALMWSATESLQEPAVHPTALQWFLDEQYAQPEFPFRKPRREDCHAWVRGYCPSVGTSMLIPASLVFLPYRFRDGEKALSFQSSVGTSCARDLHNAAQRAVLELVERDALTICWESHVPYPPVLESDVNAAARRLGLWSADFEFRAFLITSDLDIPTVLVLALTHRGEPAVAIGTAADLEPWQALRRALEEAVTSWRSTSRLCRSDGRSRKQILESLRLRPRPADHALYHGRRGSLHHFEFLLDSGRPPHPIPEPTPTDITSPVGREEATRRRRTSLAECLGRLASRGHPVSLFELTQPDVAEAGLFVVRAVASTLARQSIGLTVRHLGNRRIVEVPARLGYTEGPLAASRLLEECHPSP